MFGTIVEYCIGKMVENNKTKCRWQISPEYSDPIRSQKLPSLRIKRSEINYCPVGWNLAAKHCQLYGTVQTLPFPMCIILETLHTIGPKTIQLLEYPIPPLLLLHVTKTIKCWYLGNREWYHRSTGVKTTEKKFWK